MRLSSGCAVNVVILNIHVQDIIANDACTTSVRIVPDDDWVIRPEHTAQSFLITLAFISLIYALPFIPHLLSWQPQRKFRLI